MLRACYNYDEQRQRLMVYKWVQVRIGEDNKLNTEETIQTLKCAMQNFVIEEKCFDYRWK
jgi:hypothetical protein